MNAHITTAWTLALALAVTATAHAQASNSSLMTPLPMLSSGLTVAGQVPPPPPPPPAPPAPSEKSTGASSSTTMQAPKVQLPMMPKGQLVNVRVEFTITDQIGTRPPTKKTMAMTVADKESSRIRTNGTFRASRQFREAPLSVDVFPTIEGNKIRLEFSLEYSLIQEPDAVKSDAAKSETAKPEEAGVTSTSVSERLSAILESGVPLVIAQSSDALTDRKLTVEVKATIVK